MRLASIAVNNPRNDEESLEGNLVVVAPDGKRAEPVPAELIGKYDIPTLRWALNRWDKIKDRLQEIASALERGQTQPSIDLSTATLKPPITQASEFLDGSAFISHVERARKARGAEPPETLKTDPLMYQGKSDFLAPTDDISYQDESHGLDLEAEVAVITGAVPEGASVKQAGESILLVTLMNDISLRGLIPNELMKGFGFVHGKPASALAPFAISVDELEKRGLWKDGRLTLDIESSVNGKQIGNPNASTMHFSFPELVAHAARTRSLRPGTVIGSGTVSEPDTAKGVSCLTEKRILEIIENGEAKTEWLKAGDTVTIKARHGEQNLFGTIHQKVVKKENK